MAKGVLGGMTDYRHQSLDDIIQDLRNERENTIAFKRNIKENLAKATIGKKMCHQILELLSIMH